MDVMACSVNQNTVMWMWWVDVLDVRITCFLGVIDSPSIAITSITSNHFEVMDGMDGCD